MVVDMYFYDFDSRILPVLQSIESLHTSCCQPEAEVRVVFFERRVSLTEWGQYGNSFDLSLFYSDDFPANPSPLFKTMIQQLARKALTVTHTISPNDLINPMNSPSQAAIDIAKTLTFDTPPFVAVLNAPDFVPLPNTPSPHPTIIEHLQPFPTASTASRLCICSALGGEAGRLLAKKMPPEVKWVLLDRRVSAADRRDVLEALGAERRVEIASVGWQGNANAVSLAGGALDGWVSDSFPSIAYINIQLSGMQCIAVQGVLAGSFI